MWHTLSNAQAMQTKFAGIRIQEVVINKAKVVVAVVKRYLDTLRKRRRP
jgi:hypothetical protein